MSATDNFEDSVLRLIFFNTAITDLAAAGAANVVQVSLHSGTNQLEAAVSAQATQEVGYTSYGRIAVTRTSGTTGWTLTSSSGAHTISNITALSFPQATGGDSTAVNFGIGATSTGAGTLYLHGTLTASLNISNGITPQFAVDALTVTLD